MARRHSSSVRPALVWFRLDLRLADHPALTAAVQRGGPVVPVFIWAPEEEGGWPPGAASRWWLHQSLLSLAARLRDRGSRLIIRRGPTLAALRELARESGADAVFWSRRYEPAIMARDTAIERALKSDTLLVQTYNASLLFEPWTVRSTTGGPFRVFTPFWKSCLKAAPPAEPVSAPRALRPPPRWPGTLTIDSLGLEPAVDWAGGIRRSWSPGEEGALRQLRRFVANTLADYPGGRDRPDLRHTSRLSPHLHFGEIGPRQVWHAVEAQGRVGRDDYLRELGWREFAHHVLFHVPHTAEEPLRPEFAFFPWKDDAVGLRRWQRGRTGYPIVDAGMRELWETGWMHNRVRMIVASFLVKDLLVPWQAGARWFWDTLVDADLANNTLGWQWTAGCGADAAPYFRIFNPTTQGEKFDPAGGYVRRWVPEIADLPDDRIHRPWEAAAGERAQIRTGRAGGYPEPIIDHRIARPRALAALASMQERKRTAGGGGRARRSPSEPLT